MKIHLRQIPAGGVHLEDEEDCPLSLLNSEEVRRVGPLRYVLDAGISEGALWVRGELTQPVQLHCVRCLEPFAFDIKVKDFAVHTELTGPEEIDLTPFMREDILLNLPAYPHCDREGNRVCPAPITHHREEAKEEKERPTDWSALDKLKLKKG